MSFADEIKNAKYTLSLDPSMYLDNLVNNYLDTIQNYCRAYSTQGHLKGYLYSYADREFGGKLYGIYVAPLRQKQTEYRLSDRYPLEPGRRRLNEGLLHYPDEVDVIGLVNGLHKGIHELGFIEGIVRAEYIEQEIEVVTKTNTPNGRKISYEKPAKTGFGIFVELNW